MSLNLPKKIALENGASSAEVDITVSSGKSISVRLQKLETIEQQNDKAFDRYRICG
jgi:predicted Zn-dependent protease